jgi:outer membrane protein assembly factor BamB
VWSSEASDGKTVWATTGNPDPNGTRIDDSYSVVRLAASTLAKLDKWTVPAGQTEDLDFGSSPTLFANAANTRRFVGACNKNGRFYAWNQDNLAAGPVWSRQVTGSEFSGTGFCITSAVWDFSARKLFLAAQTRTLGPSVTGVVYELNPDNGAVVWRSTLPCGVIGTPSLNAVTHVLAVGQGNCPAGTPPTVRLFNANTGAPVGTVGASGEIFAQPVFAEGHLYVADEGGQLAAYAP